MRRRAALTALALAAGFGFVSSASATECTPKGCSTGCSRLDVDRSTTPPTVRFIHCH